MPQGMFGPVSIVEHAGKRALQINGQMQGEAYLSPGANVVAAELSGPGPVHTCAYMNGWFAAAAMNPTGSGLMIGLGSGQGAISLLYNFPGVDLTVIEIDPVIVQVALEAFPLLGYYLNRGSLNIVVEDALAFLHKSQDKWDFGCADAYTGGNALVDGYMHALCDRADNIYVNCIDVFQGDSMVRVCETLAKGGKPVVEGWRAVRYDWPINPSLPVNWILTTQEPDPRKLDSWEPFQDLDTDTAADARRSWAYFLSSSLMQHT